MEAPAGAGFSWFPQYRSAATLPVAVPPAKRRKSRKQEAAAAVVPVPVPVPTSELAAVAAVVIAKASPPFVNEQRDMHIWEVAYFINSVFNSKESDQFKSRMQWVMPEETHT